MNREKLDTLYLSGGMRYLHVQTPTETYAPPVEDTEAAATCRQIIAMEAVCQSVLGASIEYVWMPRARAVIAHNGDTVAVAVVRRNHSIIKSLNRSVRRAIGVKPTAKPQPVIATF